jgi:hypothetical protein
MMAIFLNIIIAFTFNSWINPFNPAILKILIQTIAEENTKQVNAIYLETWAIDINEFDSLQYETLYNIANENAATGGNATYAARVMLGLDVEDNAIQSNRFSNQTVADESNNEISIFPNPVANTATIVIGGVENEAIATELKDVLGKIVLPFKKLNATGTIEFGKIPNGIYFLAVYLNGNYLSTNKLIVSH